MAFGMGRLTPATISGVVADAVLRQSVNLVLPVDDALPTATTSRDVSQPPLARRIPRQINASAVADLIRGRRDHEMIDRMYIVDGSGGPEIVFDFVARRPGDHSGWNVTPDLPRGRLETDPRLAAKETLARFQADDAYRTCLREEAEAAGIDPVSILSASFATAATDNGEATGANEATTLSHPTQPSDRTTQFGEAAANRPDSSQPVPDVAPETWKGRDKKKYKNPAEFIARVYAHCFDNLARHDLKRLDRPLYDAYTQWILPHRHPGDVIQFAQEYQVPKLDDAEAGRRHRASVQASKERIRERLRCGSMPHTSDF